MLWAYDIDMAKIIDFWVSPAGDDSASGDQKHPYMTLTRAIEGVRAAVQDDKIPANETIVHVQPGIYPTSNVEITETHTARGRIPLTIKREGTDRVRLSGALEINELKIPPSTVLSRVPVAIRDRVRMVDLSECDSIGAFASRGMGRPLETSHAQLFFDDRPGRISVYPKHEFLLIAGFPDEDAKDDEHGGTIGDGAHGFCYDDTKVEEWQPEELVVHGYWCWDWANTYERIDHIDADRKLITLRAPGSQWGFRSGNRYQFFNVLEELSEPGEYVVDTTERCIYFLPLDHYQTLSVSVLPGPAVRCAGATDVRFAGITFEQYRGSALSIEGGESVCVDSCTLRNLGNEGIRIDGGQRHQILRCRIHDTGDGAISIGGGDRTDLTPADHVIDNNHIHHFGLWSRCYVPAIHAQGVGMRISRNLIHDAPHSGIIYWGNEFVIEYNEIHHVTMESGDAGAIYTGRDFSARGNVIRYNYIHDTGGEGMGSMGIYWDDCVSGQTAYGNLFLRVSRGVMMGGGRELVVRNNLFVDTLPAIQIDARGISPARVWQRMVNETMAKRLEEVDYLNPPYSERYPALRELEAYLKEGRGVPPEHNLIANNICSGGVWIDAHVSQIREFLGTEYREVNRLARIERNLLDFDPGFNDRDHDDFSISDTEICRLIGFEQLPLDEIGPTWL